MSYEVYMGKNFLRKGFSEGQYYTKLRKSVDKKAKNGLWKVKKESYKNLQCFLQGEGRV